MSPFWILLELRMLEVVVTTGAISRVMLQSNCHHQQTNTQLFTVTGRMSFLSPNLHLIPGQGEIYKEHSISSARQGHSAVMSRPGLYLVKGKAAME